MSGHKKTLINKPEKEVVMTRNILIAGIAAGLLFTGTASLIAGPPDHHHHHHHDGGSSGVRLATDIVNLVRSVVEPRPVVVAPAPAPAPVVVAPAPAPAPVVVAPAPAPAPVVVEPAPAAYEYRYYNGAYVVYYNGWYWYNNSWIWGSRGAPPPRPYWRPRPGYYHHHPGRSNVC